MIHDNDLRDTIHAALDEVSEPVPGLVPAAMARIRATGAPRRRWSPALQLVGILTAAAVIGGITLASHRAVASRQGVQPSAAPAVTATVVPTAVNASNCRLPVIVMRESGRPRPQGVSEVGFVDTATGQYSKDASASVQGLPGGGSPPTIMKTGQPAMPAWYSHALGRWLPVDQRSVAPDGRSYLWVQLLPAGSTYSNFQSAELHRFDVARASDVTVWSYAGSINVWFWDSAGILLDTVPPTGGIDIWWRVDPSTGAATQQPRNFNPGHLTELPGDAQNGGLGSAYFGIDAQSHPIYRIGGRGAGERDWVFVETAPGQRDWIYRGTQGDATDFDPFLATADSTGVWFGSFTNRVIWHWQHDKGLQKFSISGLPDDLPGAAYTDVYANPAGPCQ